MNRLLNKAEVADLFGIPEAWITKAVSGRLIPHTRIGKHVRFSERDIAEIVEAGHIPAEDL